MNFRANNNKIQHFNDNITHDVTETVVDEINSSCNIYDCFCIMQMTDYADFAVKTLRKLAHAIYREFFQLKKVKFWIFFLFLLKT